ncbi:hypothetical protein [Arcobacter sp. LA11]|uniref:hypothetical protein n=1 Tax=Arcobacter sp. LA11 TaxID=1898176 RepID=UPI0009337AAD|nr:hypothetical protein [Arcobacter sp. LA11]
MLVSNNSLLNILLPNENKVLKDVLKEADAKTLNSLKGGNTTVGDILKNLFSDLKTGDKNKATIENMLKNSNLFKDLGTFSKSITTLLNQIDSDSNLSKYKSLLQSFLKDISTMDEKSLKDLISKSGVFLESKVLEQAKGNTSLPKNLENILNQIRDIIKNIPGLDAKKVESLIDKLLTNNAKTLGSAAQNNADLKSIVSLLQTLSKNTGDKQLANLSVLTNSLKDLSSKADLLESKVTNNPQVNLAQSKEAISTKAHEVLSQLKNELILNKNIPNNQTILKQIDNLLQTNNLFAKNSSTIEPRNLLNMLTNLIDTKNISAQSSNISTIVSNLKNLTENISGLENKILSNQNIQSEKVQITQDIKQNLASLKAELINIKNIDVKQINQIIDKLQSFQNIFSKIDIPNDLKMLGQTILNQTTNLNSFQSNFSSNINNLILNLKESILNLSTNPANNLQQTIIKTVEKLEGIVNNFIQNPSILNEKAISQNPIQNDMKAMLLQIQEELIGKTDVKSQDTLKQIDKMLMQVEYYQLLSISSNSNSVYIPFIWDMLDDGSISMKKLNEDKFYCEINLSLKEFGQTQLLLSLYDKNKLDLTIYASKDSFKQSIRENSSKLKQALNSVDLIPVNIKIIDLKKEEESKEVNQTNLYNQNIDLGFGIDIKA